MGDCGGSGFFNDANSTAAFNTTTKAINSVNSGSETGTTALASIFSIFSLDQGGSTVQTNQYLKMVKRVKYIGLYYGDDLELYLAKMTDEGKSKEEVKRQISYIEAEGNGPKRKFYLYAVELRLTKATKRNLIVYWAATGLHLLGYMLLYLMKKRGKASRLIVYYLFVERKVHFVAFQSTMMDLLFFGMRILAHLKWARDSAVIKSIFLATMLSQAYFTYEIFRYSTHYIYSAKKTEKNMDDLQHTGDMDESITYRLRPEDQKKSSKLKQIDHQKTIENISRNKEFENFISKKLVQNEKSFGNKLIVLNNFFTIIQLAMMQILIPLLAESPGLLLGLLLAFQGVFFGLTIYPYCSKFKFLSLPSVISKILQFVTFEAFLLTSLIIYFKKTQEFEREEVSPSLQQFAKTMLVLGLIFEYLFFLVNIIMVIRKLIQERKNKKTGKQGLIIYKEERPNRIFGANKSGLAGQRRGSGLNHMIRKANRKSKYRQERNNLRQKQTAERVSNSKKGVELDVTLEKGNGLKNRTLMKKKFGRTNRVVHEMEREELSLKASRMRKGAISKFDRVIKKKGRKGKKGKISNNEVSILVYH
jgi:hypothetical protein